MCFWESGAGTQWLADRETKAVVRPGRQESMAPDARDLQAGGRRRVLGLLRKKQEGSCGAGLGGGARGGRMGVGLRLT